MDWYASLDVTEKILSGLAATVTLLAVVFTIVRPRLQVTAKAVALLLSIILAVWVGHGIGKRAAKQDIYAIQEVIEAEGQAIINQDLSLLESIYDPDAIVIHCEAPDESADVVHKGLERIKDRYWKFFASGWTSLTQVDLSITVTGNKALAKSQGIVINASEFLAFPSEFTLERKNSRWVITSFECK